MHVPLYDSFIPLQQNVRLISKVVSIFRRITNTCQFRKGCVVIGVSNRIEIWSDERWHAFSDEAEENFDELAETMIDFGF